MRWRGGLLRCLCSVALLLLACGSEGTAPDGSDAGPDAGPDTALDATPDVAPPDVQREDTPAGEEKFSFEIVVFHEPEGREGIATGDFFTPSIVYGTVAMESSYRHAMTFQITPMMPPVMRGLPTHGPLIVYTDDMETVVLSPLDHFFSALVWREEDGSLGYGLHGDVEELPAGFTHRFLLVRGRGVNRTVERWGEIMRGDRGRPRVSRYADLGLSHMGYWTDNGAAYYYRTAPGMNEEETLLAVRQDAIAEGIPYSYFQLNSWWYEKEETTSPIRGGLVRWEPLAEMFPDWLEAFRERLGLPLILHNRWFAKDNIYRDEFEFVDGEQMAFPVGRGVFDRFMADAARWGAFTYEQDWLVSQYWGLRYLREREGRGEAYMAAMDDAARDKGLTVQICMAGAAHLMDTVDRTQTTTVRTSIDYAADVSKESFWPQFHTVNMLAWALGIWPFKDNFQSSERHGMQEALISALSGGMVGPSDAISAARRDILMRTCREDGLLLKPDRPATVIDAMLVPHARPLITMTWSDRSDIGRSVYLSAYHIAGDHPQRSAADRVFAAFNYDTIPLDETFHFPSAVTDWGVSLQKDLSILEPVVRYDWRAGTAEVVQGEFSLGPMEDLYDFAYYVLAPILPNGLALIGEAEKFVTLSDHRFEEVAYDEGGIRLKLAGVPGEEVALLAFDTHAGRLLPEVAVVIGADGVAEARIDRPTE